MPGFHLFVLGNEGCVGRSERKEGRGHLLCPSYPRSAFLNPALSPRREAQGQEGPNGRPSLAVLFSRRHHSRPSSAASPKLTNPLAPCHREDHGAVTPKAWVFLCCSSWPCVSGKDKGGCGNRQADGSPDAWVDSPRLGGVEIGVTSRVLAPWPTGLTWPAQPHWPPHLLVQIYLLLQTLTLRPVQARQKQVREALKSRCECAEGHIQILKAGWARRHGKWQARRGEHCRTLGKKC